MHDSCVLVSQMKKIILLKSFVAQPQLSSLGADTVLPTVTGSRILTDLIFVSQLDLVQLGIARFTFWSCP